VREAAHAGSLAAVGGELLQSSGICGSDVKCGCAVLVCQGVHRRRIDVAESPPVAAPATGGRALAVPNPAALPRTKIRPPIGPGL
jgi:hypothetical protein